eukprot:scaffold13825_cov174-Amphora_coffeaeformis.AAC.2
MAPQDLLGKLRVGVSNQQGDVVLSGSMAVNKDVTGALRGKSQNWPARLSARSLAREPEMNCGAVPWDAGVPFALSRKEKGVKPEGRRSLRRSANPTHA